MIQIIFRAFVTITTAVVAVAVSAHWGSSRAGQLIAATIIAFVVGLVEWLMIWTPKHLPIAQKLLDRRSVMLGVWIQKVRLVWGVDGQPVDTSNHMAVFTVRFSREGDYVIAGRAYTKNGQEYARWRSVGQPMFSRDGRSMTYVFDGAVIDRATPSNDRLRRGLTKLALTDENSGDGTVEHVAGNVHMEIDFFRVTSSLLLQLRLTQFDVGRVDDLVGLKDFVLSLITRIDHLN
jgi:hypothetical protein